MADLVEKKFDDIKDKMLKLVKEEDYLRECSWALQAMNNNEILQKCSPASLQTAVYNTATTGLSLNPVLKYAALVPKYVKSNWIAVLMPMYQGLIKLVTDTGSVQTAYAYNVYEGDEFDVNYGTAVTIVHKPKFKSKKIEATYAVAMLPNGTTQCEVMDITEVYAIREKSEAYKAYIAKKTTTCIWVEYEGEMVKKTVLKRLCKYLPKTDKYERLADAIDLDNKDYEVTDRQQDYLLGLLATSTYGKDETGAIVEQKILGGLTLKEFEVLKNDLLNNQLNPVTERGNASQKEISKHIREHA